MKRQIRPLDFSFIKERRDAVMRALDLISVDLQSLAEKIGVSVDTLYSYKAGRRSPSSTENLLKLTNALKKRSLELQEQINVLDRQLEESVPERGNSLARTLDEFKTAKNEWERLRKKER